MLWYGSLPMSRLHISALNALAALVLPRIHTRDAQVVPPYPYP
jgi:hypothetical protein